VARACSLRCAPSRSETLLFVLEIYEQVSDKSPGRYCCLFQYFFPSFYIFGNFVPEHDNARPFRTPRDLFLTDFSRAPLLAFFSESCPLTCPLCFFKIYHWSWHFPSPFGNLLEFSYVDDHFKSSPLNPQNMFFHWSGHLWVIILPFLNQVL